MHKFVSFIDSLPRRKKDPAYSMHKKRSKKEDKSVRRKPDDVDKNTVTNMIISKLNEKKLFKGKKSTGKRLPPQDIQENFDEQRLPQLIARIGKRRNTVPENCIHEDQDTIGSNHRLLLEHFSTSYTAFPASSDGDYQLGASTDSRRMCSLNRPKIRTNPWLTGKHNRPETGLHLVQNMSASFPPAEPRNATASIRKSDDSSDMLYAPSVSSGYGSHDSSPACSVHSPDWKASSGQNDLPSKMNQSPAIIEQLSKTMESTTTPKIKLTHEDIGLQCSMTDDKSVYCNEDDFEFIDENSSDLESDVDFNGKSCLNNKQTIEIFEKKMTEFRSKTHQLKLHVQLVKEEYERRLRDRQLCQEQMFFVRRLKLAIHNGCSEVTV